MVLCRSTPGLILAAICFHVGTVTVSLRADEPTHDDQEFSKQLSSYFNRYCVDCHGTDEQMAGIAVHEVGSQHELLEQRESWQRVLKMIQLGAMPPEDVETRPGQDESAIVAELLEDALFNFDCQKVARPGHPTIRRLNRVEYNNTVRDLFGVDGNPGDGFPSDDVGAGFDNIGGVLSVSPLLMEKYLAAAEQVSAAVIGANDNSEIYRRVVVARPNEETTIHAAAVQVVTPLLPRVFRRPASEAEIERFAGLTESIIQDRNSNWGEAVAAAVQAMLVSPEFLFRVEQGPLDAELERTLNDHELATRLSYFLWSTMPDEELFRHADQNQLHQPAIMAAQIRRMLQDSKSQALVDNFAAQWLNLRRLRRSRPDDEVFSDFDEELRRAMIQETSLVFRRIMQEDLSVDELLTGQFTFVNERLAAHYEIDGIVGDEFVQVSLDDSPRRGILTHASILTLTSYPRRTSPVKRGKWILKNLFGDAPPPPPPDIPELDDTKTDEKELSVREQMEIHRSNPVCASCHQVMDPLGLGLENFDGIGRWRDEENGQPVDASGQLPGGMKFDGPEQLVEILMSRRDEFVRTLARKMLTYAIGRSLEYYDKCVIDDCLEHMHRHDNRFSSLVEAIVLSDAFLKRGRVE